MGMWRSFGTSLNAGDTVAAIRCSVLPCSSSVSYALSGHGDDLPDLSEMKPEVRRVPRRRASLGPMGLVAPDGLV
jgi:hypothetical protein